MLYSTVLRFVLQRADVWLGYCKKSTPTRVRVCLQGSGDDVCLEVPRALGVSLCLVTQPSHSDHKFLLKFIKMKLLCFASLLASAAAFTSSGSAFTTQSYNVGQRSVNIAGGSAHHSRKATIVMGGKANGTYFLRRIGYCSASRRSSRYATESTGSIMLGMESKRFILCAMQ